MLFLFTGLLSFLWSIVTSLYKLFSPNSEPSDHANRVRTTTVNHAPRSPDHVSESKGSRSFQFRPSSTSYVDRWGKRNSSEDGSHCALSPDSGFLDMTSTSQYQGSDVNTSRFRSTSNGNTGIFAQNYSVDPSQYHTPGVRREIHFNTPSHTNYNEPFSARFQHQTPDVPPFLDDRADNRGDRVPVNGQGHARPAPSSSINNNTPWYPVGSDRHNVTLDHSRAEHRESSRRREKEPSEFDGVKSDWADYIIHFERVATWNNWNLSEKAIQLVMSLRGQAQRLITDLSADQLDNYDTLKDFLSRRYNPAERESAYRCEFRCRRRGKTENAPDFGYALRRLAGRAYPNTSMDAREEIIVDHFINGLGNLEIKRHVQFNHPRSLDQAISFAVEFEAFEGSQFSNRKVTFEENQSFRETVCPVNSPRDPTPSHENQAAFEILKTALNENTKVMQEMKNSFDKRHTPSESRSGESDPCSRCGQTGHHQCRAYNAGYRNFNRPNTFNRDNTFNRGNTPNRDNTFNRDNATHNRDNTPHRDNTPKSENTSSRENTQNTGNSLNR